MTSRSSPPSAWASWCARSKACSPAAITEPGNGQIHHDRDIPVTDGDSYRMREAMTRKGTTLNKT
jgi:hypothetical protein